MSEKNFKIRNIKTGEVFDNYYIGNNGACYIEVPENYPYAFKDFDGSFRYNAGPLTNLGLRPKIWEVIPK